MSLFKSFAIDPVNWMMFMPPPPTYNNDLHNMFWVPGADKSQGAIPCTLHIPHSSRNPGRPVPYIILYCHGNAMDLGECGFMDELAGHLGTYAVSFDYNGYGLARLSKTAPSEYSTSKDVETVYKFLRNEMEWPAERIILYGQSIGSGIAAHCAYQAQKKGEHIMALFLQSGYTSIRDVAVSLVGFAGNFILNRFNTKQKLKELQCPILFTHGNFDEVIPYHMSKTMHEYYKGHELRIFHTADGRGHNNMSIDADLALPMANLISRIEETRKEDELSPPPENFEKQLFPKYGPNSVNLENKE